MKIRVCIALLLSAVLVATTVQAADPPMPAKPTKEHEWLKQLVGEWETAAEATIEPGKPPMKCNGVEKAKMIGDLWILSEIDNQDFGMVGVMTVGYDPAKKKFVGTWIDSMTNHMWKYEGTLDDTRKVLTLEAEGPNMASPGKMAKYRDVTTLNADGSRTLTSSMQTEDGQWVHFMKMDAKRKK